MKNFYTEEQWNEILKQQESLRDIYPETGA